MREKNLLTTKKTNSNFNIRPEGYERYNTCIDHIAKKLDYVIEYKNQQKKEKKTPINEIQVESIKVES